MEKIIDGVKIEYNDVGEGEAIFLLHGWGSKKELFEPIVNTVSPKYRAVAFDLPGFGGSDEPPEVWDVDRFADICIKFIASFNENKVILLGHSFGGRVIIKIASGRRLPFEISRIILVDSAGIMPKRGLDYKIRVGTYKLGNKLLSTPPMKKLFPNAVENRRKKKGSADYAAASPIMRGCLTKAVNEDLTPLLEKIPYETLLIWGTADADTPLSDGETMEKLLPNAGLAKIEGAGHFSWLDNPQTFSAIIRSYLKI
ncbi:MAG: alpha/beta hydrolase [Clostridia bacterium]|nr:alpha/beta hydrolase [Clostridia bacterium]